MRLIDAERYKKEIFRIFPCNDKDDKNIRRATEIGINNAPTVLEIPDNPTNGDMIKALFPNFPDYITESISINFSEPHGNGNDIMLYRDWWNAPYKGAEHDRGFN